MGGYTARGPQEQQELLAVIGVKSFDELLSGIPGSLAHRAPINLPPALSESEAIREFSRMASKNASVDDWNMFLGAGIYDHFVPSAVSAIASRSEFLTAYTPYQPEVSQGTLQAIFEYQSLICEITGMDASNASLYDGATALAEAAIMAQAVHKKGRTFLVPASLNPLYLKVLKTYLKGLGIQIDEYGHDSNGASDMADFEKRLSSDVFGAAVQTPNFFGIVEDVGAFAALKAKQNFVLVAVPNLVSLALLEAPGKLGADICAGEAHYFASGVSFGGPLLGFLSARIEHIRQMPGRIAGQTVDKDGKRGFVLTAQTREQHIRREKATSNICSNEGLLALSATIGLSLLGKNGFTEMAGLNVSKTQYALNGFKGKNSVALPFGGPVFNEFVVELRAETLDALFDRAAKEKIVPGVRLDRFDVSQKGRFLVCVTEKKSRADIDALLELFA